MIPNIRYNIILMTFLSALDEAGDCANPYVNNAELVPFWRAYLDAWFEALVPPKHFFKRMEFLELWKNSEYDLISFSSYNKNKIDAALRSMKKKMPNFPHGKANRFLERCQTGTIPLEEIKNKGLGMALHFVWDNISLAREFGDHQEQIAQRAASKKAELAREKQERRDALREINPSVKFEKEDEVATSNDAVAADGPALDLTLVNWNDEVLSGLCNVDPSIDIGRKPQLSKRPEVKRQFWMPQKDAVNLLWTNVDKVCNLLATMNID